MNYDEKIKELEDRIEVLERAENKRKRQKRIKIACKIAAVVLVIVFMYYMYVFIKPYLKQITDLSGISDRAKEGGSYLKEQYNSLVGE